MDFIKIKKNEGSKETVETVKRLHRMGETILQIIYLMRIL